MNFPDFQPMSPDEMQRMMQFLLNQQAQFDARLERLSVKTDSIADGLIGLTSLVGRVGAAVDELAAAQLRTDQQLRELQARLGDTDARLTTHIEHVESHLNVVIEMFERHLREDHGLRPS